MKKAIIAVVSAVLVVALAVGGYFVFFNKSDDESQVFAYREDFLEGVNLVDRIAINPDRYQKVLVNDYKIPEDTANSFFEHPEDWLAYEQIIEISNKSEENITVYGFEVKDNGKNGVYISTDLGSELGIAAGTSSPVSASFSVLCNNNDLSNDEVKALADKMEVKIIYSKTPTEYEDGSESVEESKTAPILAREEK